MITLKRALGRWDLTALGVNQVHVWYGLHSRARDRSQIG